MNAYRINYELQSLKFIIRAIVGDEFAFWKIKSVRNSCFLYILRLPRMHGRKVHEYGSRLWNRTAHEMSRTWCCNWPNRFFFLKIIGNIFFLSLRCIFESIANILSFLLSSVASHRHSIYFDISRSVSPRNNRFSQCSTNIGDQSGTKLSNKCNLSVWAPRCIAWC